MVRARAPTALLDGLCTDVFLLAAKPVARDVLQITRTPGQGSKMAMYPFDGVKYYNCFAYHRSFLCELL